MNIHTIADDWAPFRSHRCQECELLYKHWESTNLLTVATARGVQHYKNHLSDCNAKPKTERKLMICQITSPQASWPSSIQPASLGRPVSPNQRNQASLPRQPPSQPSQPKRFRDTLGGHWEMFAKRMPPPDPKHGIPGDQSGPSA